jgi:hypothetical protein
LGRASRDRGSTTSSSSSSGILPTSGVVPAGSSSALRLITAVAIRATHVWSDLQYLDMTLLKKHTEEKAA